MKQEKEINIANLMFYALLTIFFITIIVIFIENNNQDNINNNALIYNSSQDINKYLPTVKNDTLENCLIEDEEKVISGVISNFTITKINKTYTGCCISTYNGLLCYKNIGEVIN